MHARRPHNPFPADRTTHSPPTAQPIPRRPHNPFPVEDLLPPPHNDTPSPSIFSLPSQALPLPLAAPTHTRRSHNTFPAEDLLPPPHSDTPFPCPPATSPQPRRTPAGCAMHSSPPSQHIPRQKPSPVPAQRHALPAHFHSPRSADTHPQAPRCIPRRPHNTFPVEDLLPPPRSDAPFPSTSARPAAQTHARRLRDAFLAALTTHSPPKAFARPCTATRPPRALSHSLPVHFRSPTQPRRTPANCAMHTRRPHDPFPAEDLRPPPQRRPTSPSVPLRAQKNGTAQCMCDAECLGRPSLRSVIGVGEPRAVRRRCGALAWRVGLRPQPWALRSRRCGRVLRA